MRAILPAMNGPERVAGVCIVCVGCVFICVGLFLLGVGVVFCGGVCCDVPSYDGVDLVMPSRC